ncbi:MarR family EPS-associated transcriptional regulator [Erythrobacter insulae]|uniref:MarR family EPS-associated transcriptional regulator n=1 Tax=Erythrobacter insulae TaxID=2584124 RepID=A0A547PB87_9SPHN|nr:MarR family EPS-associated transcriptional regulator [Erythrobacter insulae]TRD11406.1 MarR family EPS-associated transcriptional regulator [Erythrobacter insulae]
MKNQSRKLKENLRFRILRSLDENPELSKRELAEAVGISVGSAHFVLNSMIEAGLVKLGNFRSSQDKRRYAYVPTPQGLAEKAATTGRFLKRKMEEYEALKLEISELKADLRYNSDEPAGRFGIGDNHEAL